MKLIGIQVALLFFLGTSIHSGFSNSLVARLPEKGLSQSLAFKGAPLLDRSQINLDEDDRMLFENKEGEVIQLASLKGKVVFVNFWATWCPPCIAEMPSLQKLYFHFNENEKVEFILLDVDNNREKSQKFMDRRNFTLPVYTPVLVPPVYVEGGIPTTIVVNKYGKIVFKHVGMGDFSSTEFIAFIEQLIAE